MMNSTLGSYFTLSAYIELGLFKYMFFVCVLCIYMVMVCANVLLIVVICMNRSLHEPMYMFLCSLFVNELCGGTSVFPLLLVQILSDVHTISVHFCLLQLYCIHTYGTVEYLLLTIMSYDRYLAICCPLQYSTRMSTSTISKLLAVVWLSGVVACVIMVSQTSSMRLCGNVIDKVYCDNYSVVRLACSDTSIKNIFGLIATFSTIGLPMVLIVFTYLKIMLVCSSGCKQSRQKAFSTCVPHVVALINFSVGSCFEIVQSRFNMKGTPNMLRIILSLYWLTVQLLLNPLMYGFNLSKIRIILKNRPFAEL
nr:olfactory receptor 142-like [Solea senegalensis]